MGEEEKYAFGLRFELQYDYLKSTDLSWLFSTLRAELIRFLIEERIATRKSLRGARVSFELTEARSGNSILIDIFPFLHGGASWTLDMSIPVYIVFRDLYHWWINRHRLANGGLPPFGKGRRNIRRFWTRQVKKRFRPDGSLSSETLVESEVEQIEWKRM